MKRIRYLYHALFSEKQVAEIKRIIIEQQRSEDVRLIKNNIKFKNIHKGERCFIIGNGPSINEINFARLEKEITFTVNQLPRNDRFPDLHTNYHLWSDERFFQLDKDNLSDMELLGVMKQVRTDDNSPTVFYKTSARDMILQYGLNECLNIEYFMDGPFCNELSDVEYPITRALPVFSTCIHYAIVIAIYMGFEEIYLLGCDCTGIINILSSRMEKSYNFEYAYSISNNERTRMGRVSKMTKISDEFFWYGNLLKVYGVLYEYAKKHGCYLYNATSHSAIDNIPKVNLDEIL